MIYEMIYEMICTHIVITGTHIVRVFKQPKQNSSNGFERLAVTRCVHVCVRIHCIHCIISCMCTYTLHYIVYVYVYIALYHVPLQPTPCF